jgi:hypothetical protein
MSNSAVVAQKNLLGLRIGWQAQECRQLQDKLIGDQPLTPQRGEEITNTMAGAGCTARFPSADAGVPPRFPAQR